MKNEFANRQNLNLAVLALLTDPTHAGDKEWRRFLTEPPLFPFPEKCPRRRGNVPVSLRTSMMSHPPSRH